MNNLIKFLELALTEVAGQEVTHQMVDEQAFYFDVADGTELKINLEDLPLVGNDFVEDTADVYAKQDEDWNYFAEVDLNK